MIWYVAVGGAVGSACRFLFGALVQQKAASTFPVGTLVINVTGSILLGVVLRYALGSEAIGPEVRALLTTGFCGGYTTFSTFSYETAALIEEGQYDRAALYIALSCGLGVVGTFLGFAAGRELLALRGRL